MVDWVELSRSDLVILNRDGFGATSPRPISDIISDLPFSCKMELLGGMFVFSFLFGEVVLQFHEQINVDISN